LRRLAVAYHALILLNGKEYKMKTKQDGFARWSKPVNQEQPIYLCDGSNSIIN
jgi:hypothetical protein